MLLRRLLDPTFNNNWTRYRSETDLGAGSEFGMVTVTHLR